MNNKLVFVISFAFVFVIFATTSEWISSVNAQGLASLNNSASGNKTTSVGNSPSIITPWNTGNSNSASSSS